LRKRPDFPSKKAKIEAKRPEIGRFSGVLTLIPLDLKMDSLWKSWILEELTAVQVI
jgi:hypothetical protein